MTVGVDDAGAGDQESENVEHLRLRQSQRGDPFI